MTSITWSAGDATSAGSGETMVRGRPILLTLVLVMHVGCTTFRPMSSEMNLSDVDPMRRKIEVEVSDGHRFVFPAGQYRVEKSEGGGWKVSGWGDLYGKFGLMGSEFYIVRVGSGTIVKTERVDLFRSIVFAGVISGLTVATYLGIRAISAPSDKAGGGSRPPTVN